MKIQNLLGCLVALALLAAPTAAASGTANEDDPTSFASPVHAGCYLASPTECRIHVDPFTANVAPGQRLERFQLKANGSLIYDFGMDVSNFPIDDYTPTLVRHDFYAECGVAYQVGALTEPFTCPSAVPPTVVSVSSFAAAARQPVAQWLFLLSALLLLAFLKLWPERIKPWVHHDAPHSDR